MASLNLNVLGRRFLWPVLRFGRRTSCNKLTEVASLLTFSFCNDTITLTVCVIPAIDVTIGRQYQKSQLICNLCIKSKLLGRGAGGWITLAWYVCRLFKTTSLPIQLFVTYPIHYCQRNAHVESAVSKVNSLWTVDENAIIERLYPVSVTALQLQSN